MKLRNKENNRFMSPKCELLRIKKILEMQLMRSKDKSIDNICHLATQEGNLLAQEGKELRR